jgi:opacity protein-like surface antigen
VTALVGARWVDVEYDVGLGALTGNARQDWVDPWVGGRAVIPLNETFMIRLRGDVGGFGVGTEFSWQAMAFVAAALSSSVTIDVGYRGIGLDYRSTGLDFDVVFHGPVIGLALSF